MREYAITRKQAEGYMEAPLEKPQLDPERVDDWELHSWRLNEGTLYVVWSRPIRPEAADLSVGGAKSART